jgi:hypothetical protein
MALLHRCFSSAFFLFFLCFFFVSLFLLFFFFFFSPPLGFPSLLLSIPLFSSSSSFSLVLCFFFLSLILYFCSLSPSSSIVFRPRVSSFSPVFRGEKGDLHPCPVNGVGV